MFNRCSANIEEQLDRLAQLSRPSVICSNPIAQKKSSENQFDTDKYIYATISNILAQENAKKALKRKASKSIPKKLQVNFDFTIIQGGTYNPTSA